jgi:hypothetical protein
MKLVSERFFDPGLALVAIAAVAALIAPHAQPREAKHFPLESATGLRLNNVTAEPAALPSELEPHQQL